MVRHCLRINRHGLVLALCLLALACWPSLGMPGGPVRLTTVPIAAQSVREAFPNDLDADANDPLKLRNSGQSGGLDPAVLAASSSIGEQLSTSEWLGPLAPIALSPFFGICTLSGIATYGPEWLQQRSALFGDASSLNNHWLFWSMLALAITTSLPRFMKVSKPLALAAEKLEAYAAIIILVVVRFASNSAPGGTPVELLQDEAILSAGVGTLSLDVLMSIFAALNVIVINGVKLFCEFLIWLIPFPAIDAAVEVGNKSLCAGLTALYCYSPAIATSVNLLMLLACAMVFSWTHRRLRYYREIIAGPVLARVWPSRFAQRGTQFVAFNLHPIARYPRYTRWVVQCLPNDGLQLRTHSWWRRVEIDLSECRFRLETNLLTCTLRGSAPDGTAIVLSQRRWVSTDALGSSQRQVVTA